MLIVHGLLKAALVLPSTVRIVSASVVRIVKVLRICD
jgi:hypothetical protein